MLFRSGNLTGPALGCSHLRPLCFQDLGRGQVLPGLGLCLGVATLKKCPQAGPSVTQPRGWGQPPTQDLPRRGAPYGAAQASRPRRWKAPPWGGGGRWVKAAETELTRTPPPPQPQVPQALSEQTALFPLDVCVRGNSGEGSITQNL